MISACRHDAWTTRGMALLTIAGLLLGTACGRGGPAVDVAAEEAALRQRYQDFAAAEATNNADSALTFLWEDAVMQPPNAPQIQGHEAIRALYGSVTFVSLTPGPATAVVSASGDLAALWGPVTVVLQGPDGPITDHAKVVTVWQRRGGVWKVLANSWSSDTAPPGS
jgi:ketosteroid isomerase-like protein